MNRHLAPLVALVLLNLAAHLPPSYAGIPSTTPFYLQILFDKPYFYPGDAGRMMIDIRNTLSNNIQILNISVSFPWKAYVNGRWDGNQTIYPNVAIAVRAWMPTQVISFTTPSDSRYFVVDFYPYGQVGAVDIWAQGTSSGGGTNKHSRQFAFPVASFFGAGLEWHTINLILIIMTALIGIMTVSVVYYVRANLRRGSPSATPPPTPPSATTAGSA